MTTQTESVPFAYPFMPGVPALPGFAESRKFFLAGVRLQAYAAKAALRYQIEALSFLKHRCEQDMKLVDDLVSGEEFNDAFDVVSNFMQNAATEYAAEVGKVASIGSKLASEAAKGVREEVDAAIEDIAAQTVAA